MAVGRACQVGDARVRGGRDHVPVDVVLGHGLDVVIGRRAGRGGRVARLSFLSVAELWLPQNQFEHSAVSRLTKYISLFSS